MISGDTPSASNVWVTLTRVTFLRSSAVCEQSGFSDFFTAVGGGFNLCGYGDAMDGLHMLFLDCNFTDGTADYGGRALCGVSSCRSLLLLLCTVALALSW
jgi:hypothetical protein